MSAEFSDPTQETASKGISIDGWYVKYSQALRSFLARRRVRRQDVALYRWFLVRSNKTP